MLEAKQSSQTAPAEDAIAAAEATDVVCPDEVFVPAVANQPTGASDPVASPSPPIPEEPTVPSVTENLTVRASDGNVIRGLEDVDGV